MPRHASHFRISAVLVEDGKFLVIHRKKNGKEYFILVGGTPEEGETPEQTLVRETKEEANLDIKPIKKLGEIYNDFDGRTHFFYLAEIIGGELKLGGGEFERNNENNRYILEWRTIGELEESVFYPKEALGILKQFHG